MSTTTHATPDQNARDQETGFSLIELAIGMAITAIVALGAITALVTVQTKVNDSAAAVLAQQDARELLDRTLLQLRSAAGPGACANPPSATTDDECIKISTRAEVDPYIDSNGDGIPDDEDGRPGPDVNPDTQRFTHATADNLCYYAFPRDEGGSVDSYTVPFKYCINRGGSDNRVLLLREYHPDQTENYTQPANYPPMSSPTRTTRLGTLNNPAAQPIFEYYDQQGTQLGATGEVYPEDLGRIATIRFTPQISFERYGNGTVFESRDITISVRSTRFHEERNWINERFGT